MAKEETRRNPSQGLIPVCSSPLARALIVESLIVLERERRVTDNAWCKRDRVLAETGALMHGVRATFDFLHLGGVLAFLPFLQHPDALDATDAWRDACRDVGGLPTVVRVSPHSSECATSLRLSFSLSLSPRSYLSYLSRRYSSKSERSSFSSLGDAKLFRVINGTLRSFLRRSQPPFIRQTSLPENSRGSIAGEEKCERCNVSHTNYSRQTWPNFHPARAIRAAP